MLIMTRTINDAIVIENQVKVRVLDVRGNKVKLGIEAPRSVTVHREEVQDAINGKKKTKKT